jgi:hypothetical protein
LRAILTIILAAAVVVPVAGADHRGFVPKTVAKREKTWECTKALGVEQPPSNDSFRRTQSHKYRKWVYTLWSKRAKQHCVTFQRLRSDPKAAIRWVWGDQAEKAINVARCETGGTFSVYAQNGQYLGLFQMGSWARSRYGHGYDALTQARAAYANYRDNGWSQWECSPHGAFRD